MNLILDIDPQNQQTLEQAFGGNLCRAALEALVIEGYRTSKLTKFQVRTLLGQKDRWETEIWLKQRHAFQDQTIESVMSDAEISRSAREAACSSSPTPRR